jgi:hypothetical protein
LINLNEWATEKVPRENLAKFVGNRVQGDQTVTIDFQATGNIKTMPQPQPAGAIG